MSMKDEIGWMHGTLWTTKEACEEQCRILHHRLGIKEAPRAVIPVAALRARLKKLGRDCAVQSSYEARVASDIYTGLLAELEGV